MSKEIKIGLIAAFLIALLIWGINFLKGKDIFSKSTTYLAIYDEIGGLEKASHVYLNGFKIGMVENLRLTGKNKKKILVRFTLEGDIKIPKNSRAMIYSDDLMGTKAIRMNFTDENQYYEPGDTIPSHYKKDITEEIRQELKPIKTKTENLITTMDSILSIFDAQNRQDLQKSIGNIQTTSNRLKSSSEKIDKLLKDNRGKVNNIVDNTDSLVLTLSKNKENINRTLNNLSSISDSLQNTNLNRTITHLEQTLASTDTILTHIKDGKGSAGKLIKDDSLYNNLNKTSTSLNELLEDIKENPQRYIKISVFGKNK
ncbi:MAG: MlaD family protein [Bacteroidales bacterium]